MLGVGYGVCTVRSRVRYGVRDCVRDFSLLFGKSRVGPGLRSITFIASNLLSSKLHFLI